MSKKQWYQIEIECIKYNPSSYFLAGEKDIIAKVKSKGLAYIVAQNLEATYGKDYFKITIK